MRDFKNALVWAALVIMVALGCAMASHNAKEADGETPVMAYLEEGHPKNCPACQVFEMTRQPFGDETANAVETIKQRYWKSAKPPM